MYKQTSRPMASLLWSKIFPNDCPRYVTKQHLTGRVKFQSTLESEKPIYCNC